jgi:hypothetical protein
VHRRDHGGAGVRDAAPADAVYTDCEGGATVTEEELAAIRARAERATEATGVYYVESPPSVIIGVALRKEPGLTTISEDDALFIAHPRRDVLALLADMDRLRDTLKRVRALLVKGSQG